MPAGADFTAIVRFPNGSVSNPSALSSSAMRAYSICCAGVRPNHQGISSRWLHSVPRRRAAQHLFEQDSFVGHVLVDDPQTVAPRGDDEAVVDLAERTQVVQARPGSPARQNLAIRETAGHACRELQAAFAAARRRI